MERVLKTSICQEANAFSWNQILAATKWIEIYLSHPLKAAGKKWFSLQPKCAKEIHADRGSVDEN